MGRGSQDETALQETHCTPYFCEMQQVASVVQMLTSRLSELASKTSIAARCGGACLQCQHSEAEAWELQVECQSRLCGKILPNKHRHKPIFFFQVFSA